MADLQLKSVKKYYGQTPIVHEVNIDINHGEMIVVVGPSGCGKSTLLRMIAGLETVSAGEIIIDNKVVNHIEPKSRDIAMVFQNYALYPHMTVYDNMAYGLRMRGKSKKDIFDRVSKAAKILQLEQLLERKPKELSGGQRQRVAMGRAIVREPKIFLFDEPLSNLDANLRVQMRLEIHKLQKEFNITSIYVTHDQIEAMTLADRLVVMRKGVVEQIGNPIEVYLKPASIFVAGFIGSPAMNFLAAKISQDGMAIEVTNSNASLPLADDKMQIFAGKNVTLGIRPESIKQKLKPGADHLQLQVKMLELLGVDTMVYGNLVGDSQMLTARMPGKWRAKLDEIVTFGIKPDSLHIFDPESGLRLN